MKNNSFRVNQMFRDGSIEISYEYLKDISNRNPSLAELSPIINYFTNNYDNKNYEMAYSYFDSVSDAEGINTWNYVCIKFNKLENKRIKEIEEEIYQIDTMIKRYDIQINEYKEKKEMLENELAYLQKQEK